MILKTLLTQPIADEVAPSEARRRHAAGGELIDVREPEEYVAGHAPGARLIPLGQLAYHLKELPRDGDVLFLCRSGRRSGLATQRARRAGIRGAMNVRGGMIAWARAGLPVEK